MVRHADTRFIEDLNINPQLHEFQTVHALITSHFCRKTDSDESTGVSKKSLAKTKHSERPSFTSTFCHTFSVITQVTNPCCSKSASASVSSTVKAIIAQFSGRTCYDSPAIASFGQAFQSDAKQNNQFQQRQACVHKKSNGPIVSVKTEQPQTLCVEEVKSNHFKKCDDVNKPAKCKLIKNKNYQTMCEKSYSYSNLSRHDSDPTCSRGSKVSSSIRKTMSDNRGMCKGKTRPRIVPRSNVSQKVMLFEKCCRANNNKECELCCENSCRNKKEIKNRLLLGNIAHTTKNGERSKRYTETEKNDSNSDMSNNMNLTEDFSDRVPKNYHATKKSVLHAKVCKNNLCSNTAVKQENKEIKNDAYNTQSTNNLITVMEIDSKNTRKANKRSRTNSVKRTPSDRYQSIRKKLQKLISPGSEQDLLVQEPHSEEELQKILFLDSIKIPMPAFMEKNENFSAIRPTSWDTFDYSCFKSLPDHCIEKIFSYLDTRSLAMLKCTTSDFKFIIERYDIRPTDSQWVKDKRYHDDPCKYCRRLYLSGDTTMCRYHPKSYHCGLPYGRSYWMCCLDIEKSAPGCQTGLHDNNWTTLKS